MAYEVVELECPGCGAAITTGTKQCPKCFREIMISTFNSVASMAKADINRYAGTYRKALAKNPDQTEMNISLAFCYLKLKLYDKAFACFEKAIGEDIDNSEAYFYAGICLLDGERPFLVKKAAIEKIEEYLSAATMIEPKGIYYYFLAYIKYDFYELKKYHTDPNYVEAYADAKDAGLSETDIGQLYEIIGTQRPDCL